MEDITFRGVDDGGLLVIVIALAAMAIFFLW